MKLPMSSSFCRVIVFKLLSRHRHLQALESAQRCKSTDNNVVVLKRARTIRNKAINEMHKNFSNMTSAIAAMAPKLDGLINVLSYEKEVADLHAKLKSELNNME
ncbi:hypothetical protein QYF36_020466 [Acer negundo]|nr:hypothetical protein QYF36_020466 [Acer negundo]